jgi:glucosamine kinase
VALFLGIDGGGSKTACVVSDETATLGRGVAGGSNLVRLDEMLVRESLHAAIRQACGTANISPSQLSKTCMGVAGAGRAAVADRMRSILGELIGGEIQVVGDADITLEAAFGAGPGVIVIAGTGSIAYGRDAQANVARAGGWGFAISDEGSGHWIGQRAIAAAMRARDEGEGGVLLDKILQFFGVTSTDQLVIAANASPAPEFAKLFPIVAVTSDPVALQVLNSAGEELAGLAHSVIKRLFSGDEPVAVAMSGGVFRNSPRVRDTFIARLIALRRGVSINSEVVDPVEGALALARK